jgi:hypothetical protein
MSLSPREKSTCSQEVPAKQTIHVKRSSCPTNKGSKVLLLRKVKKRQTLRFLVAVFEPSCKSTKAATAALTKLSSRFHSVQRFLGYSWRYPRSLRSGFEEDERRYTSTGTNHTIQSAKPHREMLQLQQYIPRFRFAVNFESVPLQQFAVCLPCTVLASLASEDPVGVF